MISKFVWAAIGGLITSVLIPFTTYFVIRFITKSGIRIIIRDNEQDGYKTIRLILKNNSKTSLRNVVTFVSINNDKNDIISDFKNIFCKHGPVEYCLTSWAKNVDNKNYPNIDINQGECPDFKLNQISFELH